MLLNFILTILFIKVQESVLFRGKLEESYNRICSLETGLHMKLEQEHRSLHSQRIQAAKSAFKADCNSASKLIHYINSRNRARILSSRTALNGITSPSAKDEATNENDDNVDNKVHHIRPQPVQLRRVRSISGEEDSSMLGGSSVPGPPAFSTPVRCSLRRRPRTIVGLEDLQTPIR